MKFIYLSLFCLLAVFSVSADSVAKEQKSTINLMVPQGARESGASESNFEKPDDALKEFDITTQKSRLDQVRRAISSIHETMPEFQPHSGKSALFLDDQNNPAIEPEVLKGLLYPNKDGEILEFPRQKLPLILEKEEELGLSATPFLTTDRDVQDEEDQKVPFQVAPHKPMVTDLGGGDFLVDESFERQIPTLIDMNKLAYAIGKRGTVDGEYDKLIEELKATFKEQGWEIKEFEGKTGKGNRTDDTPGFVAYNKEENVMTVILRGSQTRADADGSPDWEVNFDATLIDFPFGGKVHGGFYNRSTAMLPNIQKAMNEFLEGMEEDAKSKLKILVSGHSQGAALASIIMPLLVETFKAAKTFGENFNNAVDNVVQGYFISTPRVYSGEASLGWAHNVSGKHNMIRQNVTGTILADPVPIGAPGRTMTALLSLLPFSGEGLAEKYGGDGGTRSVGYLAADWSREVLTRQLGNDTLDLLSRRAKKYFWNRWDIAKETVTKPWQLLTFQTQKSLFKKLLLEPLKDGISTLVAPLHYGSTGGQIEDEALFGRDIVAGYSQGPTMAELLKQGFEKKQSERKGVSGFVRSTIEKAAEFKASQASLSEIAAGIASKPKKVVNTLKGAFRGFKRKLFGL